MRAESRLGNSTSSNTVLDSFCFPPSQRRIEHTWIQDRTSKYVVSTNHAWVSMARDSNCYSFPSTAKQLLRYVSDRTGIISWANFPVIWLFGMRNNLLMWLTGWDFGTYNNFHRWVARIATLQAVVHSIGYTWLIVLGSSIP